MINRVNQVFREHFGSRYTHATSPKIVRAKTTEELLDWKVKNAAGADGTMTIPCGGDKWAAEIIADQERLDEEDNLKKEGTNE